MHPPPPPDTSMTVVINHSNQLSLSYSQKPTVLYYYHSINWANQTLIIPYIYVSLIFKDNPLSALYQTRCYIYLWFTCLYIIYLFTYDHNNPLLDCHSSTCCLKPFGNSSAISRHGSCQFPANNQWKTQSGINPVPQNTGPVKPSMTNETYLIPLWLWLFARIHHLLLAGMHALFHYLFSLAIQHRILWLIGCLAGLLTGYIGSYVDK